MARSFRSRSRFVLAIGFLLLICSAASAIWLSYQQRIADGWVRHTYSVEAGLNEVQMHVMRAEIGRRGFLLLGTPESLSTYAKARKALPVAIAHVQGLTADNLLETQRVAALRRSIDTRLITSERSIALRRAGWIAKAARVVGDTDARADTARMLAIVAAIHNEETRLLGQRLLRSEHYQLFARITLTVSIMVMLALAYLVSRERRERLRDLRDANEQLETDIARREVAESQLELLATHATDAVFRLDLKGICLYASPSVCDVIGYPPDILVGREMLRRLHPDDKQRVSDFFDLLAGGVGPARAGISYRAERPDNRGQWMWLDANCRLVRDTLTGAPKEIIASLRDVTPREVLKVELEGAKARAEAAARAKSIFLANMSHEIRTPMNGVLGFTDLLLAGNLSDEQRHQAELIAESGRAMMRLLNDILDLSKVEAGQMKVADEPFDLPHALKACLKLITPAVAQKGVELKCELSDDLPRLIRGDGLRLRQIILNLLGNAAKFTDQGSITLRAWTIDEAGTSKIVIEIEDTGIGIQRDRQAVIFEQFVQADGDIVARFGGTGLGLSISVQLARLMGGEIELASEPGEGTRFFLRLPFVTVEDRRNCDRHEDADAQSDDMTVSRQRPLRVLVAEDHDVNQMLISGMLKQIGCQSAIARDGAEAVMMVVSAAERGSPYDIVLMDMQMPNVDGQEATLRIRAAGFDPATLPIVALTANAYADDIAACLSGGMQAHLAKPLLLADLQAALKRWAGLQAMPLKAHSFSPKVRERYRVRKEETLHRLGALVRRGRYENAELADVVNLLHKLAGSAGMFGELELGRQAQELETGLLSWREDEIVEKTRCAIAALQQVA